MKALKVDIVYTKLFIGKMFTIFTSSFTYYINLFLDSLVNKFTASKDSAKESLDDSKSAFESAKGIHLCL